MAAVRGADDRGVGRSGRETLAVGFLPVTCHLTCPVTDYASKTSLATRFESQRFTDFPTVVETLKSGRLDATFMIAPLAMKLREQGVKVRIAYLGHRDGSTVMVRKDLPAKSLKDLAGRVFAIPSKYSNQYLVIRKLMKDEGVDPGAIRFVELPPPDMPGALASKAIDAYFIGEPHAARAELDGSGRVLYHAKDIWPRFISCVLVVTERLIAERPAVVRDLVRGIAESGEWAETHRVDAARLVAPYFRQDESLIRYVLTQPPDRVSYRMLTPRRRRDAADCRHGARSRHPRAAARRPRAGRSRNSSRPTSRPPGSTWPVPGSHNGRFQAAFGPPALYGLLTAY